MPGLRLINTALTPLTLSLSPWERGRCCTLNALFRGPFSHGEKDRMRGGTPEKNDDVN
jgi:hypothetical protein